jgi:rhamnosyltransferase
MTEHKSGDFILEKKIAAVTVLYNPASDLWDNIKSYLDQVQYLYLVDNSCSSNGALVAIANEYKGKIEYIANCSNLGIATALNIAAARAIKAGYMYLLTMDQDSVAVPGMVKSLMDVFDSEANVGLVSPIHSHKYSSHKNEKPEIYEVNAVMTSGNIISLKAFLDVGCFREDYFIDYVDVEFCIRLHVFNYKVLRNGNTMLIHNEGNISKVIIFNKDLYPVNSAPFRWYYKTRNYFYLKEEYEDKYPALLSAEKMQYRHNLLKIFFFEKKKINKLIMVLFGFIDYLRNKKGRRF